jgi:hypothetical protein
VDFDGSLIVIDKAFESGPDVLFKPVDLKRIGAFEVDIGCVETLYFGNPFLNESRA